MSDSANRQEKYLKSRKFNHISLIKRMIKISRLLKFCPLAFIFYLTLQFQYGKTCQTF